MQPGTPSLGPCEPRGLGGGLPGCSPGAQRLEGGAPQRLEGGAPPQDGGSPPGGLEEGPPPPPRGCEAGAARRRSAALAPPGAATAAGRDGSGRRGELGTATIHSAPAERPPPLSLLLQPRHCGRGGIACEFFRALRKFDAVSAAFGERPRQQQLHVGLSGTRPRRSSLRGRSSRASPM
ncbi:unnamed protein product [Lampetra planeri]